MSSNEDRVQGAPPTQNAPIGEVVNGAPKDDGEPAKSQESSAQPKLSVMSKLKGLWAKVCVNAKPSGETFTDRTLRFPDWNRLAHIQDNGQVS